MCVDSLLNRRYLQVSESVRVRRGVVGRLGLGLGLGLGLALGLQLGMGIGHRRNHSWSSIFTPRRIASAYNSPGNSPGAAAPTLVILKQ